MTVKIWMGENLAQNGSPGDTGRKINALVTVAVIISTTQIDPTILCWVLPLMATNCISPRKKAAIAASA